MTVESPHWENLVAMFFEQADNQADKPFLWAKLNGAYEPLQWGQVAKMVAQLARGLIALGVGPGDRVVIVSENRPEWLIADMAVMATGAITVPAYTTNTESDHLHILENSGAKGAIVSTRRLAQRLLPAAHRSADMKFVIAIDPVGLTQHLSVEVHRWDDVMAAGEDGPDVVGQADRWRRNGTACIIYTSGTGGAPKGVMLHHGALLHNCEGARQALTELGLGNEVFLSFLPLSHSYEHTAGQFFPIHVGAQIYYSEGPDRLAKNMQEVQPTLMISVPRLYELMHAQIVNRMSKDGGARVRLFFKALELGKKRFSRPRGLGLGDRIADTFLDWVVRNKVRGRFGGRLKAMVSGGAPLNPDIAMFFTALGLRILQGYGLTESAPVIAVNTPKLVKMHTVGPIFPKTEVRIAEDGEILVRGELVMQGYWRDPELTSEVIKDGWLHTGDVGRIDEDGHLEITDRKKDIIVNSGGDNISPQRVEGMLTLEPEISQAMVSGDRKPHLVGILVPETEWMGEFASSRGLDRDLAVLSKNEDFHKALAEVVDRVNGQLSNIEKVRRFIIAREMFTIENGQITPTLKIRRHAIRAVYGAELDELYR